MLPGILMGNGLRSRPPPEPKEGKIMTIKNADDARAYVARWDAQPSLSRRRGFLAMAAEGQERIVASLKTGEYRWNWQPHQEAADVLRAALKTAGFGE